MAASMLLVSCTCAFALNPALDINQYAHTAWKISDEVFAAGVIFGVTQTPDGYIWVATDAGLMRFDGVRSIPWQPPPGTRLPSTDVRKLVVARDGRLWIGTSGGVASWKDGVLSRYPEIDGRIVEALLEDREGTIWVATATASVGSVCAIRNGKPECDTNGGRFGTGVTALYEDRAGNLWAGARTGLWRWKPGAATLFQLPDPDVRINELIEDDDGAMLVTKSTGITKVRNGRLEPFPFPRDPEFKPGALLRDRDGGLWIGAVVDGGLLHVHNGRVDRYSRADGLSGNSIPALFEDREGSIWVSTGVGLDRFREFAVTTMSVEQGLSSYGVESVVAAKDGTLWIATDNGLDKFQNGDITVYRSRSPRDRRPAESSPLVRTIVDAGLPTDVLSSAFEDSRGRLWVTSESGVAVLEAGRFVPVRSMPHGLVRAVAEDRAGTVWLSQQQGLFGLRESRVVEQIPWSAFGRAEPATALTRDEVEGGLWVGFRDGAVARFTHGRASATYAAGEGLAALHVDANGGVWAATDVGLSYIKDGRTLTLDRENGLPCSTVHWMTEDAGSGSVWLFTACALVRLARSDLDQWASNPASKVHSTVFDALDGVQSQQFHYGYSALAAWTPDGRLWFVSHGGVSVVNPRRLAFNAQPPPVHVEQVTADDTIYAAVDGLQVPPRIRNLAIDYTALSFVAPEKVRFRYRLEGQDENWKEVVNDRQVQYSNLAPGPYRFRVQACNNSGVWNEAGDSLSFFIAPALYQRASFRVLCVIAFLLLLFAMHRMRVRQVAWHFNRTLEARVSERTRIARDLHDTLLQSYQGLLLRFQSVSKLLPDRPVEAKGRLDSAIDQAAAAITEGRDAVQGLRSSAFETNDLANAITAVAEEFTRTESAADSPAIEVEVEGTTRDLNPVVRDEAYRIATEALRNAFRHAEARRIVVAILYEKRQFRLRVSDDGKGMEEATLRQQRTGHFGLPGMRERAEIVGGRLEVWSAPGSGTQVHLSIPGSVAYSGSRTAAATAGI